MGTVPPVALCVADHSPKYDVGLDPDGESSLPKDIPCDLGAGWHSWLRRLVLSLQCWRPGFESLPNLVAQRKM